MIWWWQDELEAEGIDALIHLQDRIVSRPQLLAAEWSQTEIRRRLRRRIWQTIHPGVYATHTGPIGYYARILAGLLYAGPDANWSHHTAAEQLGLIRRDEERPVHLTIPARRVVAPQPGLVIRRTRHWDARLGTVIPPRCTSVHAVLDIVDISDSLDDAAAIIAEACQSGRVTAAQIAVALQERVGLRYRRDLRPVLEDVAAGSHSLLEIRYLRNVERRHGLLRGTRQRGVDHEFTDVAYGIRTGCRTGRQIPPTTGSTTERPGPRQPRHLAIRSNTPLRLERRPESRLRSRSTGPRGASPGGSRRPQQAVWPPVPHPLSNL